MSPRIWSRIVADSDIGFARWDPWMFGQVLCATCQNHCFQGANIGVVNKDEVLFAYPQKRCSKTQNIFRRAELI